MTLDGGATEAGKNGICPAEVGHAAVADELRGISLGRESTCTSGLRPLVATTWAHSFRHSRHFGAGGSALASPCYNNRMQPSLEKLRKFFGLEREKKYDNSAIIGGLAKMLDYWEGEARADGVQEDVIQAVAQRLRSYEGLSPKSRADVLRGLWKRISETYPEAAQRSDSSRSATNASMSKTVRLPRSAAEAAPTRPLVPSTAAPSINRAREAPHNAPAARPENQRQRQSVPSRSDAAPGAKHSQTPAALNAPLTVLQGVGPKNAATLEEIGLRTLGDMLYYYPNRYEDYSQLKPIKSIWYGEQLTVIGTIQSVTTRPIRNGASTIVEAVLSDSTGTLRLSWFNQPWLANRLREGQQISVSGQGGSVPGPARHEQPGLGTGGSGASQHQPHRAHLSTHGPYHARNGCADSSTRL